MYPQSPKGILSRARELLAQKAYPEALELCNSLLSQPGAHANVHTLSALIHQRSGNLEEAGKSMELALKENPDNPSMLLTAALINRKLKNYNLAKQQAMKSARKAPDNPQIICHCALLLGSLRESRQALQILEIFTRNNQQHAQAWYLIGKFQQELGNNEAASHALKNCLTLEPDHPQATQLLNPEH